MSWIESATPEPKNLKECDRVVGLARFLKILLFNKYLEMGQGVPKFVKMTLLAMKIVASV